MRRTKIVATLGPATSTRERIAALITAGIDVARINFSHGSYEDHAARIRLVREEAEQAGRSVAILQDLQGPKIRTGNLVGGQAVTLVEGRAFVISTREGDGTADRVSTTYTNLPNDVEPGDRILISDGLIELRVKSRSDSEVVTEVVAGGELRERQGINLPGVAVSAPSLTEKDLEDLDFGISQDVDYIALSFVRRAADIVQVKERIAAQEENIPVIAKIERPEAVEVLDTILDVVDGVMVARGDLGVEMSPERVPIIQKQIIEACNLRGIPVITATQMLESMIHNPRPTRAEASDVANAIIDGSDAVMLSGETATGAYPIESVQTMARIAGVADESGRRGDRNVVTRWTVKEEQPHTMQEAIAAAVGAIVQTLHIDAVWVVTRSGNSARLIAQQRPDVPIYVFTPLDETHRRLNLLWGVTPFKSGVSATMRKLVEQQWHLLRERGLVRHGDTVVLTGGHPLGSGVKTNFLKIMHLVPGDPSHECTLT